MSYTSIVFNISQLLAIGVIILLVRQFKFIELSLKFLTFLLISFIIFQAWNDISILLGTPNSLIYKLALPVYYSITWAIFYNLFTINSIRQLSNIIYLIGLIGISLIYFASFNEDYVLIDAVLVENLVIVSSCLMYYYDMLKIESKKPLKIQWQFFLVTGFFTYSLVSNAMWIAHKIGQKMEAYPYDIRLVNSYVYAIEILLFFWAVRVFISEQKQMKIESKGG